MAGIVKTVSVVGRPLVHLIPQRLGHLGQVHVKGTHIHGVHRPLAGRPLSEGVAHLEGTGGNQDHAARRRGHASIAGGDLEPHVDREPARPVPARVPDNPLASSRRDIGSDIAAEGHGRHCVGDTAGVRYRHADVEARTVRVGHIVGDLDPLCSGPLRRPHIRHDRVCPWTLCSGVSSKNRIMPVPMTARAEYGGLTGCMGSRRCGFRQESQVLWRYFVTCEGDIVSQGRLGPTFLSRRRRLLLTRRAHLPLENLPAATSAAATSGPSPVVAPSIQGGNGGAGARSGSVTLEPMLPPRPAQCWA